MIICPNCKEEIDDDSHYCDQCGQALVYCSNCGRVGVGRRCTHCGGLMVSADEANRSGRQPSSVSVAAGMTSGLTNGLSASSGGLSMSSTMHGVPTLMLYNGNLNIRIVAIDGAVIGRREGPYKEMFQQNMYVSGVHAQLVYNQDNGWCIIDKHSSNGTQLNQHALQPDVPMSLKNGDIVTLANNISLQVSITK